MTNPTRNEGAQSAGDIAAAARDGSMQKLEGVKGQLAEGAERVAAAVERTADNLEADGEDTVSGFGRSAASLMRQLAGGLRERDIEQFARELGTVARRNPAVFLASSVALGFGVARFFKARPPSARHDFAQSGNGRDRDDVIDDDDEETLDLSSSASQGADPGVSTSRPGNQETPKPQPASSRDASRDTDNASKGGSGSRSETKR